MLIEKNCAAICSNNGQKRVPELPSDVCCWTPTPIFEQARNTQNTLWTSFQETGLSFIKYLKLFDRGR